jgi:hypothetical protein
MARRSAAPPAQGILNRLRAQLGLYELAVTGSSVEVILPPAPEDAVAHLVERGRIDVDEERAARRFMQLRRAVIGREHVRAVTLLRVPSGERDGPTGALQWAYRQARLELRDAGAEAERATMRLLVDNLVPRDRLELANALLGLAALACHFAAADRPKRRRR